MGSAIIGWIVKAVLDWFLASLSKMAAGYIRKQESEATNEQIKEKMEASETVAEQQEALDDAGSRLGRR